MTTKTPVFDTRIAPGSTFKPRILDGFAKWSFLKRLQLLRDGELTLIDNGEKHYFGALSQRCALNITIYINDSRFYSDIVFGGSIGAGEAYMAGYWDTDNLTGLIQLFIANRDILEDMDGGLSTVTVPLQKGLHWLNRNTHSGSRKNIAAHYDIGNDFFKLMLDETMMYSSAIFTDSTMSLYDAQVYRLDTICQKLELQQSDHLLEIGTGWGGLSIYAAKSYGCQVTTTTISQEQYQLACQRVKQEGLSHKITVLFEDYRNLTGLYDKLVSIEMIEAVGHQYYDAYFRKCGELLKQDGIMLLQAITIADQQFEAAKHSVDFIKRYIFPGSCIPSITAMQNAVTRATDLRIYDISDIGRHYATTLRKWRENVFAHLAEIKSLGYSNEFLRMWEFYLCYCEGGFLERVISDVHLKLVKPDNRCN